MKTPHILLTFILTTNININAMNGLGADQKHIKPVLDAIAHGNVSDITFDQFAEALQVACMNNYLKIVDTILTTVTVNDVYQLCSKQNEYGNTALHYAILLGHHQVAQRILALPRSSELCRIKNDMGNTALHHAAFYGRTDIVKLLLELSNANELCAIQNNRGKTALNNAEYWNRTAIVALLKEKM